MIQSSPKTAQYKPTRHSPSDPDAARYFDPRCSKGLISHLQDMSPAVHRPSPGCDSSAQAGLCLGLWAQVAPTEHGYSTGQQGCTAAFNLDKDHQCVCISCRQQPGYYLYAQTLCTAVPLICHALALEAAQQLAPQMKVRWPLMSSFTMFNVHEPRWLGPRELSRSSSGHNWSTCTSPRVISKPRES